MFSSCGARQPAPYIFRVSYNTTLAGHPRPGIVRARWRFAPHLRAAKLAFRDGQKHTRLDAADCSFPKQLTRERVPVVGTMIHNTIALFCLITHQKNKKIVYHIIIMIMIVVIVTIIIIIPAPLRLLYIVAIHTYI